MQYARFAGLLHDRGCNVLVPRLPGHGEANRMTTTLALVSAQDFIDAAGEALDIATGLGKTIAVSGISLGATLCAWLVTNRADIDRCVPIAPTLGIGRIPFFLSRIIAGTLASMPSDRYAWWDAKLRERETPRHAYPRYPLRALGECFQIGESVVDAMGPFPGSSRARVTFVINPLDGAVSNDAIVSLARRWQDSGTIPASVVSIAGLPPMHDIIEPENPHQRIALVYPRLLELILDHQIPGASRQRTLAAYSA